ncbi:MAG TPA: hypothetical protein VMW23_04635 [Sedimentisphaerales bacterium]|nr:hypothetical protein [Sedimentisphaerales bacterium]
MSALAKESITKSELEKRILSLNDGSRFDFTKEYLEHLSAERLRHIFLYAKTMRIKKPT